jgi:hypothetical protein
VRPGLPPLRRKLPEDGGVVRADAPLLVACVNRYQPTPIPEDYEIEFIDYDWRINNQPKNLRTAAR